MRHIRLIALSVGSILFAAPHAAKASVISNAMSAVVSYYQSNVVSTTFDPFTLAITKSVGSPVTIISVPQVVMAAESKKPKKSKKDPGDNDEDRDNGKGNNGKGNDEKENNGKGNNGNKND
jgi:hypothetical protein